MEKDKIYTIPNEPVPTSASEPERPVAGIGQVQPIVTSAAPTLSVKSINQPIDQPSQTKLGSDQMASPINVVENYPTQSLNVPTENGKSKKRLIIIIVAIVIVLLIVAGIAFFLISSYFKAVKTNLDGSNTPGGTNSTSVPFEKDFGSKFSGKLLPGQGYYYYHKLGDKTYKISINPGLISKMRILNASRPYVTDGIVYNLNDEYRYKINSLNIENYNIEKYQNIDKVWKDSETAHIKYYHFSYKGFDVYTLDSSIAHKVVDNKYAFSITLIRTGSNEDDDMKVQAIKGVIDLIGITPASSSSDINTKGLIFDQKTIMIDNKLSLNLSKVNVEYWIRQSQYVNQICFQLKNPDSKAVRRVKLFESKNYNFSSLSNVYNLEDVIVDGATYKLMQFKSDSSYLNEFHYQVGEVTYSFDYQANSEYGTKYSKADIISHIKAIIGEIK